MTNRFVFAVQNGGGSTSLYSSNGTAAGTVDLGAERFGYTSDGSPIDYTAFDNRDLFLGYTAAGGALYGGVGITDGTETGTSFTNIGGPDNRFAPTSLAVVGSRVLVSGVSPGPNNTQLAQIWSSSNGTDFSLITSGDGFGAPGVTVSGNLGFFAGTNGGGSPEGLWRTDGTAAGTFQITDGDLALQPSDILSLGGGKVVFSTPGNGGTLLMESDGTRTGVRQIQNPSLGFDILTDNGGASTGSRAVFSAVDAAGNISAWATDGTNAGTVELVVNGPEFAPTRHPNSYLQLGNKVLFDTGYELLATNGTKAGTVALTGSESEGAVAAGSKAFFFDPEVSQTAIFATDGTPKGTVEIQIPNLASFDGAIRAVGNQVVFTGTDLSGKEALWSSDGTSAGTSELTLPAGVLVDASTEIGALPASSPSGPGVVTLPGGNQLYAAAAGVAVVAGTGNDTVLATAGDVTVTGGAGTLTFFGGSAPSSVFGGAGPTRLFSGSGGGHFTGGTAGNNILVSQGAASGNTTLTGAGSGDQLFGSAAGNDVLVAGAGRESILGGGGHTTINGGAAADVIFTGAGSSSVYGGTAAGDTIVAGSGSAMVTAQKGDAIFGGTGSLSVKGSSSGADSIVGGQGALKVSGTGGNMLVVAGTGTSQLDTGNGASLIFGGTGTSTVTGGTGSMEVELGSGHMSVTDGTGAAKFDVVNGAAAGTDMLSGFKVGTDTIDLFGYASNQVSISTGSGNSLISLADGTRIEVLGVTKLGNSVVL